MVYSMKPVTKLYRYCKAQHCGWKRTPDRVAVNIQNAFKTADKGLSSSAWTVGQQSSPQKNQCCTQQWTWDFLGQPEQQKMDVDLKLGNSQVMFNENCNKTIIKM